MSRLLLWAIFTVYLSMFLSSVFWIIPLKHAQERSTSMCNDDGAHFPLFPLYFISFLRIKKDMSWGVVKSSYTESSEIIWSGTKHLKYITCSAGRATLLFGWSPVGVELLIFLDYVTMAPRGEGAEGMGKGWEAGRGKASIPGLRSTTPSLLFHMQEAVSEGALTLSLFEIFTLSVSGSNWVEWLCFGGNIASWVPCFLLCRKHWRRKKSTLNSCWGSVTWRGQRSPGRLLRSMR